jgi:hypothetical protein
MTLEPTVPTLETLAGLWTRSLIAWPDGRQDTTTQVLWLQGPGFFADLRQPAGAPDFAGIHRLADITDAQLAWMSTQEAFAGELHFDGEHFEWQRDIDLQPRAARADRGRLQFERGVLVERGEHGAYIEHWHRDAGTGLGCAARLQDESTGNSGYLVRVGTTFMYARGSGLTLPRRVTLANCVQSAPTPEAARRLLDFEVSFGRISPAGWRIERSSLPFRRGQLLGAHATSRSTLLVQDSDFAEGSRERHWRIVALRGHADDAMALTAAHPLNTSDPMPGARP